MRSRKYLELAMDFAQLLIVFLLENDLSKNTADTPKVKLSLVILLTDDNLWCAIVAGRDMG